MGVPIIYLSYDGMTDPLGQSQVLPYLCELSKFGFSFTIISCEKPELYSRNRAIIERLISGYDIEWHPLKYRKKPAIISTIIDLAAMRKKAIALHEKKKFSIVHCRGHIPALIGLYLKKNYEVKFLFDMRGFWADEKVDAGAWNLKNPVFKLVFNYFKKKEQLFIEAADNIVCLTENGLEEMLSWNYIRSKKDNITVIPCCVDTDLFNPSELNKIDRDEISDELGISKTDYILSYLGSIGTWYMLDEMMDFFKCFKEIVPAAKFLLITHDEHERIRNAALERGIEQHVLIRPAKRSEVPLLLSLSKCSLFFIRSTYSKKSSSPTKQAEIMALGIPVICNSGIGDTDTIVTKFNSGIIVNTFNNSEYQKAIGILQNTSFDYASIRKGALDFFSLSAGVKKYHIIYTEMLNTNQANLK